MIVAHKDMASCLASKPVGAVFDIHSVWSDESESFFGKRLAWPPDKGSVVLVRMARSGLFSWASDHKLMF